MRAKKAIYVFLMMLLGCFLIGAKYPGPAAPVFDQASLLTSLDRTSLDQEIRAHKDRTGHEISVVTIQSLEGETIEEYAVTLFRQWGLGTSEKKVGVLLLLARRERLVRIEVGDDLEYILTDLTAARIITDVIAPKTKKGDWSGGITDGARAIMKILDGAAVNSVLPAHQKKAELSGVEIFLVIVILIIIIFLFSVVASRSGRGGWSSGSSSWSSGGSSGGGGGWGGGGSSSGGGASGSC